MIFKSYKKQLRENALIKYKGTPPSIELVKAVLEKSKLSLTSFEITYGIVIKTITRYVLGQRGMPAVYWHIFYEFDNLEKFYSTFKVRKKREAKKEEQKPNPVISQTNKSIIDAYRRKFN